MFDIDEIAHEADKRYLEYTRGGPRGQIVRPQDSAEYWYALVAYEIGKKDGENNG